MTTGPSAGPASAYPTLSRPASICFSAAKDVLVPGLIAGNCADFAFAPCAFADPIEPNRAAASEAPAIAKNWRRRWLISSGISSLSILRRLRAHRRQNQDPRKPYPHLPPSAFRTAGFALQNAVIFAAGGMCYRTALGWPRARGAWVLL